jgi:hypothetical protein
LIELVTITDKQNETSKQTKKKLSKRLRPQKDTKRRNWCDRDCCVKRLAAKPPQGLFSD